MQSAYPRAGCGSVLHFYGADPLATALDDVFGTVRDLHVAVGANGGNVSGVEPIILVDTAIALMLQAYDCVDFILTVCYSFTLHDLSVQSVQQQTCFLQATNLCMLIDILSYLTEQNEPLEWTSVSSC